MARAIHFRAPLLGNSYPQIGHSLLLASISMAQEGHSFLFMAAKIIKLLFIFIFRRTTGYSIHIPELHRRLARFLFKELIEILRILEAKCVGYFANGFVCVQ